MTASGLVLTSYFGEHTHTGDRLLVDALIDLYERHGLRASVVLRGVESFGVEDGLRTERLLSLSEDLPLVVSAVDVEERMRSLLPAAEALTEKGLITLEHARLIDPRATQEGVQAEPHEEVKLTLILGRRHRDAGGQPAHIAAIESLRRHGAAGAIALLGVDGVVSGARQRAKFIGANTDVPLSVVAVGTKQAVLKGVDEVARTIAEPMILVERVQICKRAGELLARPRQPAAAGGEALRWQKLTVYSYGTGSGGRRPLHVELIRRLSEAGSGGATTLRGIWGFRSERRPRGESAFTLRRRAPVVTTVIDTPERMAEWFEIVDELTVSGGLVTSESIPVARAGGPGGAAA